MPKLYQSVVALLALVATLPLAPAIATAQSLNLTLLHINDVYEISPKRGKGGLAQLMTLLEQERARAGNHLTTFGGDLFSPSVMSGLRQGAQMVDVMNSLGIDAAGLGNHEFDFGADVAAKRMAESKFPWLATNVLGADGKPFGGAKATILRDIGGFKIGLFALLTPETSHLSSPGNAISFVDVATAAADAVAALKKDGADFIIAITHLDLSADRALARKTKGLDVILGGHDHDPIAIYEGGKLILKAGYDAHYLAVADLRITKQEKHGKIRVSMLPQFRFISTAGVAAHAEVGGLVAGYEAQLDKDLNVVVGTTTVALDSQRSSVRSVETSMGNLIAEAMRAAVNADVGLTNGGGIRGDRTYEAGATLTRKDMLTELPFGNVTVVLELTGTQLRAALENGVSRVEDKAGRFPQVAGLRFAFDPAKPAGSRVLEVQVGGAALVDSRAYKVATNDYIAKGGDGYSALKAGKVLIDAAGATLMASQVIDYIAGQGSIAPKVDGRIQSR